MLLLTLRLLAVSTAIAAGTLLSGCADSARPQAIAPSSSDLHKFVRTAAYLYVVNSGGATSQSRLLVYGANSHRPTLVRAVQLGLGTNALGVTTDNEGHVYV
jgi:hypothetical protein